MLNHEGSFKHVSPCFWRCTVRWLEFLPLGTCRIDGTIQTAAPICKEAWILVASSLPVRSFKSVRNPKVPNTEQATRRGRYCAALDTRQSGFKVYGFLQSSFPRGVTSCILHGV